MNDAQSLHPTRTPPIAIVGLAGTFPGASRVDLLWQNLLAGRDSITEVPDPLQ